ncbi:hypothetical protein L486_05281 [Kwoniella mangroviensis CBS 10435]|uniref:Uncharacterized protein n=1 Tax=Kwoniella mangroviensis CBS 10435 TaxID=1331196 RepID=A0A1B9IQI3_9TREE|nr:hypothetical protein L486_05281 [Kwoniella mangroviensis CBS 10435]
MYSELKENDIYFAFYFDVYEMTNPVTDDFYTGKEPYYTLSCWIQRKEGENTPSHYVLSAQSPWVSGDFGDNLELICPKSEYKCNRDKCEGEYALPTEDINTMHLTLAQVYGL